MCIRDSINAEYGGAQAASMADRSSFIADPNGIELTAAPLGPAPVGCTSQLSTWMKLEQRQATAGVEMRAGLISFLTMSYVMVVNPSVMSPVSYTHLRAHETPEHLVCRLLLEKKKKKKRKSK
eukprot:TRINITY_DN11681_c0_g1_i1.p1 TRINITY_DN11681_c0_g1~~TRINITY_DN11681_c0_g1_i1.p1  ORF type:complete len:123 (-),score=46.05 TRINITY_DN11681_c0_g1_i1:4-372(-)